MRRYLSQIGFIYVLFCLPFCIHAQTSIVGTITQSFNANATGKPDEGAKICVLKYEGDAIALYEIVNNFLEAKKLRTLNNAVPRLITIYKDSADVIKNKRKYEEKYLSYQNIMAKIKADEVERLVALKAMDAETTAKFDLLDQRSSKAVSQIKLKAFNSKAIADAAGIFAVNTTAGKYILLLISNNRTGLNSTELSGKILAQLVDVKEGEKVNISYKFYPD